jgi:hypothetical protein
MAMVITPDTPLLNETAGLAEHPGQIWIGTTPQVGAMRVE